MIDLDPILVELTATGPRAPWSERRATEIARATAHSLGYRVQYEPGDEEWAFWHGEHPYVGMISVRFPLAIVLGPVAAWLREREPDVHVEVVGDLLADELRASPSLLRETLLRWGWDREFDPEGFSGHDLFFESV